jgi:hypothetical protein
MDELEDITLRELSLTQKEKVHINLIHVEAKLLNQSIKI